MEDAEHAQHIQQQIKLIEASIRTSTPLWKVLKDAGWSYDDLRYEHQGRVTSKGYVSPLSEIEPVDSNIEVVSFFSGGGGLDVGLEVAGFKTLVAIEHNELFCKTLTKNFPKTTVIGPPNGSGDVSDVASIIDALSGAGVKTDFSGVFVGGPPCQPFSIAANQRFNKSGPNFKRTGFANVKNGNLLFDYIDIIVEFRPAAFFIENVPGLLEIDGGEQIQHALGLLRSAGYSVGDPWVIEAAIFGVPQYRKRAFIVGSRSRKKIPLMQATPTRRTALEALVDLPRSVLNHETRKHSAESISRYMKLDYGKRDQLGRVDRLSPVRPSKTVIAGGTNGGGRSHLHPLIPRTLSVRESARLQTFPDSYEFVGPSARQFTQVGNAVPPLLGARLGIDVLSKIV